MRHSIMILSVVFFLVVAPAALWSETESEAGEPAMSPEMQAEMEAWMKLAQPAAHHKHLEPFVGSWKGAVTMWMAPDAEPMLETSAAEVSWILGDRFLEWKLVGNFVGSPFEGRAIEGFNNGENRYESIWLDNFGTLMLSYTGSCSDDGRSRKMVTEYRDPMSGGTIDYTSEYSWIDDDRFTYTAYIDKGDGAFKHLQIEYIRQ